MFSCPPVAALDRGRRG